MHRNHGFPGGGVEKPSNVLGFKDTPTYTSGQTLNYHIEVGFYTGNYNLNYSAQNGQLKSTIYVYEMGA